VLQIVLTAHPIWRISSLADALVFNGAVSLQTKKWFWKRVVDHAVEFARCALQRRRSEVCCVWHATCFMYNICTATTVPHRMI